MNPPSGGEPGFAAGGSRRDLIAAGRKLVALSAAGGAAGLVSACGSGGPGNPALRPLAAGQGAQDVPALNHLLDLVHLTIAAYTAGIPLLSGPIELAARQFLFEELAHAGRLQSLIRNAKGHPHPPPAHPRLGRPRSRRDILVLLHASEDRELSAYLRALPGISQPLRPQLASILANNAQHLCILRESLGEPAIPSAFLRAGE